MTPELFNLAVAVSKSDWQAKTRLSIEQVQALAYFAVLAQEMFNDLACACQQAEKAQTSLTPQSLLKFLADNDIIPILTDGENTNATP